MLVLIVAALQSTPVIPLAIIVFWRCNVPEEAKLAPLGLLLFDKVLLIIVAVVPVPTLIAPLDVVAEFAENVLFLIVKVQEVLLNITPP